MKLTATIERFRSALKADPAKAALVLDLYGIHTTPLEHDADEQQRLTAIKQMINELSRQELLAILTFAIKTKKEQQTS